MGITGFAESKSGMASEGQENLGFRRRKPLRIDNFLRKTVKKL